MNILVTGNLSCFAATLAKALTNGKMKAVIAGSGSKDLQLTIATAYPVPLTDRSFRELISTQPGSSWWARSITSATTSSAGSRASPCRGMGLYHVSLADSTRSVDRA